MASDESMNYEISSYEELMALREKLIARNPKLFEALSRSERKEHIFSRNRELFRALAEKRKASKKANPQSGPRLAKF